MIQISTGFFTDTKDINESLRLFQQQYPKRKIVSVNVVPNEPMGWFVTITYEINL